MIPHPEMSPATSSKERIDLSEEVCDLIEAVILDHGAEANSVHVVELFVEFFNFKTNGRQRFSYRARENDLQRLLVTAKDIAGDQPIRLWHIVQAIQQDDLLMGNEVMKILGINFGEYAA